MVQGRLPQPTKSLTEIVLTPQTAQQMHLSVDEDLYVASPISIFVNGNSLDLTWHLRVVGLFTPNSSSDPYWNGHTFQREQQGTSNPATYLFNILTTHEALFASINTTTAAYPSARFDNYNPPSVYWKYTLSASSVDSSHIGALINGLNALQSASTNIGSTTTGIQIQNVTSPDNVINQYRSRIALAQIPVGVLLLLVVGMVLLFIGLVINLLIEQRIAAIALLRSRGASRRQVFGAFTTQAIVLGLLVLIIGPLLAIPVARLLLQHMLSAPDQQALNLIDGNPLFVALGLWRFSLAAVGVTLLATLIALFQATQFDTLTLRHETARPLRRPLWQRLYLDVLLLALALGSYGYVLYENSTVPPGTQTGILVTSPLVLVSSSLFLLAALLLFLRFFSRLSERAAHLTARRGKDIGSMLALAQIARTPRQATRMLLLLTLTTAFALFALIFSASQTQRVNDIAGYEAGADFSGRILNSQPTLNAPIPATHAVQTTLAQQNALYRALPGVTSATMGYMGPISTAQSSQFTIKAVDAATFAHTAYWTAQDSQQSLSSLMAQLSAYRARALANHIVPAIVDAATWDSLHLSTGKQFVLQLSVPDPSTPQSLTSTSISFIALARVQHIPTLSDSSSSLDQASNGGILVDYQSCADGYAHASPIPQPLPISYIWLHTRDDATALASVRSTFTKKIAPGFSFSDRRAIIATLQHDPISIDLGGILALGTFTPLVLAVIGSLLASWQSVRSRLLSFVLLRALGTTPRQLVSVLSWEQGTIYLLMLGLGILAGVLLSAMVLPILIVTSIANADTVGSTVSSGVSIQQILPSIRIVIPSTLGIVLALLLMVCLIVQGMMVRAIIRPSLGESLRLNTD